jgi:hypothetical protein
VIRDSVEPFRVNTMLQSGYAVPHFGELLKSMRAFRTDRALDRDPDNVLNHNPLQVRQAERYAYSSSPDFSLTEGMFADQPGYRKGPRPRVF